MILPILRSTLLPTDRLHARCLALNVFLRFMSGWFSSQMENIPSEHLDKLFSVDDPFQFPDLPLRDGKPVHPADYDPMMAAAVLIEFASSNLWRNHLRRSNFASCEKILSTWDGKRAALRCMLDTITHFLPKFLCTGPKIATAIMRLEELQCLNTAEVVNMWAWTVGVINPADRDAWQLIGRDNLRFCRTHGMERLVALKRHVTDRTMESDYIMLLLVRQPGKSEVKAFGELPVLKLERNIAPVYRYLYFSQACQLRRLYQLFGYDPKTWKDAVVAEGGKKDVSLGHSVVLSPFTD